MLSRRITDLETRFVDPETMNILHQRLQDRLAGATGQDRRFVLEAVGATILAQGDGSWELELLVPGAVSTEAQEPQIMNTGPRLGWGWYAVQQYQPRTTYQAKQNRGEEILRPVAFESGYVVLG